MVDSGVVRLIAALFFVGSLTSGASEPAKVRPAAKKWAEPVQTYDIPDSELGSFKIEIADKKHPILLPLRLSVMVLCKDRRARPQAPFPKVEIILDAADACKYVGYTWDPVKKDLWVEYWISKTMEGEGRCDTKVELPYNLADECAFFKQ